jgi:hypothetical protein
MVRRIKILGYQPVRHHKEKITKWIARDELKLSSEGREAVLSNCGKVFKDPFHGF